MARKKKEPKSLLREVNGLAILIIILSSAGSSSVTPSLFHRILYSFHVPLFFLVSGIPLRMHRGSGKEGWILFFRRMVLAYLIPYFLWALIYSAFSYRHLFWLLYGSFEALEKAGSLSLLCILPAMFIARSIAELVFALSLRYGIEERRGALCGAAVCLLIGLILPPAEPLGYPWCLNAAFTGCSFMLAGFALRVLLEPAARKKPAVFGGLVISLLVFCAGTVLRRDQLPLVLMRSGEYGNRFWFLLNAISGCACILFLAMVLVRSWNPEVPVILREDEAGINPVTLGTFVIHMPLLNQVVLPLLAMVPVQLPKAVLFVIAMVLTRAISSRIIKVLVRFIPQMFGIYPSPGILILPPPEQ